MTTNPTNNGKPAEELACIYLQQQGLELLEKNYSCRQGEIDLVMRQADSLVLVEVRQRSDARFGGAAASVNAVKQRRLIFAARHYLRRLREPPPCRFDVLLLEGENIQWLRAAFDAL